MITVEQFLENNSEEERVCIAVYGRSQYDEFMRFLDSLHYTWGERTKATETPVSLMGVVDTYDDFLVFIYVNTLGKHLSQVHFYEGDDDRPSSLEWCFADEEDEDDLCADYGSNYIIKPFLRLKRELKELGLWT